MKPGVFLLDSHTLLWALGEPEKLGPEASRILQHPENRILVSVASLWELSIKQTVGKLDLPTRFFEELFQLGFDRLAISDAHLGEYRTLPLLHRDPFDRLLAAQARTEQIPLITRDPDIHRYEVDWIW